MAAELAAWPESNPNGRRGWNGKRNLSLRSPPQAAFAVLHGIPSRARCYVFCPEKPHLPTAEQGKAEVCVWV